MSGSRSSSFGQSIAIGVGLRPPMCCPQSETGTLSKLFAVNALPVLLRKARRHPLSLEATVKRGVATSRWHEPCRTQQFALRFAHRMLRNLGAPIHCFEQLMRAFFLRSSLTTRKVNAQ